MALEATADEPAPPDAVTVIITVLSIELIRQDKLEALATVELNVSGVVIEMQVTVLARHDGAGLACSVPPFIHPDTGRRPAVKLPADLWRAVSDEVLAALAETRGNAE